jgi:hypothetical protein
MVTSLDLFVISSAVLATIYLKLTLGLARKESLAKKFQTSRKNFKHAVGCIREIANLIEKGEMLRAGQSFQCFEKLSGELAVRDSNRMFLVVYSLAMAKSLGDVFHETWTAPEYQKRGVLGSIEENLNNLALDVSTFKGDAILGDLAKSTYCLIAGEKWEGENISVRAEFIKDLWAVREGLESDSLSEFSLMEINKSQWEFFYKWAGDTRDSMTLCIAALMNTSFFQLETLYYEPTPSSKRVYQEYLKVAKSCIDRIVRGLETGKYWDVFDALSVIVAESYKSAVRAEQEI